MEGKIVIHKTFGEGKIISLKDNLLTVKFSEKESVFIFPECFEGVLTTTDKELESYSKMIINNRKLEKKLLQKKGLNRRLLQTRRNVPRWHSYISNSNSGRKSENLSPKNKADTGIKRYEGKNFFAVLEGEDFQSFIDDNKFIIPVKNNEAVASIISKGDLLFCLKDNKVCHIGIVLSSPTAGETDGKDEYNISSRFIPVMAEVEWGVAVEENFLSHINRNKANSTLDNIAERCPYINNIEGIGE